MVAEMLVVHVFIHVLPEHIPAFILATEENAKASLREPGVARFDFLRSSDDETRFVLVEAYKTAEAPAAHKATAHYEKWRDTVAPMMASPRTSAKFSNVFPLDAAYSMT